VKKPVEPEMPLINIERNPVLLTIWVVLNAALLYATYLLFVDINPWGFILMTPAAVMSFLTLWLLMNPFAVFFDDKLEFRQSFFNSSTIYFIDIKQVVDVKKGRLRIVYNDNDLDTFVLYGIKSSHTELLRKSLEGFVNENISKRPA
jgi:hypothetical protein